MKIILLAMLIITSSCAGYRFKNKTNPFGQYAIRSISVPMFYNQSNFSNVSGVFTKEIYKTLLDFKDLKLHSGNKPSDAVLLGIIVSDKSKKDSVEASSSKSVKNTFGDSAIGSQREDFVVTSINEVNLGLRIIVIKHPTKEEIQFLQKDISKDALNSKIIFNEMIPLRSTYQLKELKDEATKVIATHNRGVEKQSIAELAKQAAGSFKDMMLYAF